MPRLQLPTSYASDLRSLFARDLPHAQRWETLKSLLLRSVRVKVTRDVVGQPLVPLRVRPAFILLNALDLLFLGLLGFHPNGQAWVRLNDKVLHFVCFFFATALFYMIWDVDESARRSWLWRNAALLLSFVTCFAVGGLGSEIVQSLLPYKTFQWGDVLANLLGSALGLFFSYHIELRYRAKREIERLYEPLDIQDYGDEDEQDPRPHQAGNAQQPNKKSVRFGDVWDAELDEETELQGRPLQDTNSGKKRAQDLFSIDDDEDEEGDAATTGTSGVWKQPDA